MSTKKPTDLTHKGLLAAGYTRHARDPIRGDGFVLYARYNGDIGFGPYNEVVFVGNNATANSRTFDFWKTQWPGVYKWWTNLKDREPHDWEGQFLFIKGEDPLLSEEV